MSLFLTTVTGTGSDTHRWVPSLGFPEDTFEDLEAPGAHGTGPVAALLSPV